MKPKNVNFGPDAAEAEAGRMAAARRRPLPASTRILGRRTRRATRDDDAVSRFIDGPQMPWERSVSGNLTQARRLSRMRD
jgi:hypothetical protein